MNHLESMKGSSERFQSCQATQLVLQGPLALLLRKSCADSVCTSLHCLIASIDHFKVKQTAELIVE